MKRKIFVVDDHAVTRMGYASLINREPDLMVCGESDAAPAALQQIPELTPDLVIADITLGGMNGIELTQRLRYLMPDLPVLVVSMHEDSRCAELALQAGARGYVTKSEVHEVIVAAIRKVLQGDIFVCESINEKILAHYAGLPIPGEEPVPALELSDRELEVFEHLGRGRTTQEIAARLKISPKTVEAHRSHIKAKLDIDTNTRLVQRAVQWVEHHDVC